VTYFKDINIIKKEKKELKKLKKEKITENKKIIESLKI